LKINTSTISTSTDHQLKENKHTSDTIIFGPMSPEKLNVGKSVQLFRGFYYYAVYLSTIGCLNRFTQQRYKIWQQYLSLEANIRNVCSMKLSPAQSEAQPQPSKALRSLFGSLGHSLCLCVDDAGPFGSA